LLQVVYSLSSDGINKYDISYHIFHMAGTKNGCQLPHKDITVVSLHIII